MIQYNTLLTTPHRGFSVTMQLKEVTIVSKKTKIDSKTLYYVYIIKILKKMQNKGGKINLIYDKNFF